MSSFTISIDRDDAEAISNNDFAHATKVANQLYEVDTPEASALGRLIEMMVEEIDFALTDEASSELSPDTKATLEVAKMLEQRRT